MTIFRHYCFYVFILLSPYWTYAESDVHPDEIKTNELAMEENFSSVYSCFVNQFDEYGKHLADQSATAFVAHQSGLVVTCNHSLASDSGILKNRNDHSLPFELIVRVPQYDLAFLKVSTLEETQIPKIKIIPTMQDTIHSLWGIGSLQNQLVTLHGKFKEFRSIYTPDNTLDNIFIVDMNAAPGCSGAPVFNGEGNIIGIINGGLTEKHTEKHVCSVLPSHYIEKACHDVMNLQAFKGLAIGLFVETRDDGLYVVKVDIDSDAYMKGIRPGDRIITIGNWEILNTIDYYLSEWAWGMKYTRELLPLKFISQDGREKMVEISLTKKIINCDNISKENLKRGCSFSIDFMENPSTPFSSSKLKSKGWTSIFEIASLRKSRILFHGYLEIPNEGSYGFHLIVPGTGTLTINREFMLEKLIPHPKMIVIKRGYFAQGLHEFTLVVEAEDFPQLPYLFIDSIDNIKIINPVPVTLIWGRQED